MLYVCEECQTMTHAQQLPRDWTVIELWDTRITLYLCPACQDAARAFWTDTSQEDAA